MREMTNAAARQDGRPLAWWLRCGEPCPLKKLREEQPELFAMIHARGVATRKEVVRLERMRMACGLPRKTKIKLHVVPMTQQMHVQKWKMKTIHNYFTVDGHPTWICHDKDTLRSPRMEATATRYGLRVVEADE